MHPKTIMVTLLMFFGLVYIVFWTLIIFLFMDHYSMIGMRKDIKELHTMVKDLELVNQILVDRELENIELKVQINAYEMENARRDDDLIEKVVNQYDDSDLDLMARLIESESGNQSYEGKMAVGTVVMNRVESDEFPDTIEGVIFQKGQFSVVSDGKIRNKPSKESIKAAKEILSGSRTLGSDVLYFYNPKITSKTNWIRQRQIYKKIGDHSFAV